MSRRAWIWLGAGLLAVAIAFAVRAGRERHGAPADASAPAAIADATFVGSAACASCHADETQAWRGSQHARAMEVATADSVLGRFDGRSFSSGGVTTRFSTREGKFFVDTDGPDGRPGTFEVAYTFGLYPLQQYLIEMPGGRLQALSVAWDARPAAQGGQRWFHLYPGERIDAGDPLHWTGIRQNWNFMCADCHTTNLRKGYDADQRVYHTTWTELGVGCEGCHGPGSRHVQDRQAGRAIGGDAGLTTRFDERRGVQWTIDAASGHPVRSVPRDSAREIEACARCHARRAQLVDAAVPGRPFADDFRASLLEPELYRADGQPRDEVYNYGAFLQSRMSASGVTCSDCHDPHAGTLRVPGNATCTRCHQAASYDVPAHTMHAAGTPAAACATCHMPVSTYMGVDARHDHSFRVPRPDRTASLGVPNACTAACHTTRTPAWAAAAIRARGGRQSPGSQAFAEAFAAGERGEAGAARGLLVVAHDATAPAIVRASALDRVLRQPEPVDPSSAIDLLADRDPLVRRAALTVIAHADAPTRLASVPRLLADPVRTVRTEAARALMDLADRALAGGDRATFDRAFDEFVAEQRTNADRPEAQVNLGQALLQRGRLDEAVKAFDEAIRLDRTFVPAWVDLSDAYRLRNDDTAAERVLRDGLTAVPDAAVVRHALGLTLVRQHRVAESLAFFARAAALDPANPRYAYVYAVALHDSGQASRAVDVLRAAAAKWPGDAAIAQALEAYQRR